MSAELAEVERVKYQKMYDTEKYRGHRGNVTAAKEFIKVVGMQPGSSVLDIGCGSGYATRLFHERQMRVTSADIAPNAILPENRAVTDFHCLPAWDLPHDRISVDFGFCTDVMEHIPTEKVDDTLAAIKRCVRQDVWFDVSLRKDGMGRLIGDVLHMTVRPLAWWLEAFGRHWPTVEILHLHYRERSAVILVGPHALPTAEL